MRMELKTARLTLLIDPAKKAAFERLCAQRDLTPSQDVSYVPSGQAEPAPRRGRRR